VETVRWKRLLIAKDAGQLERLTLQLVANEIRHAIGLHRPWKAAAGEPWLMGAIQGPQSRYSPFIDEHSNALRKKY
jgi:hypothetical protein